MVEFCEMVRLRLEGMAEQPGWVWSCLLLASAEGWHRSVARLAGAVRAMAGRDTHWGRALADQFQPALEGAWRALGPEEAERLAAEGAGMEFEEVIAEGLGEAGNGARPSP